MSSLASQTLHVTNGDSVVYTFKKAGIVGTHLPWRDVLHEGPVPSGLSIELLSRLRGTYLASRGYGHPIKTLHDLAARDAVIRRAREFREVVLWFEHDLYDQLQVAQILATLDELELESGHVSIVQSGEYLGYMVADELLSLYPKRRTVTNAMFAAGRRAWGALTSADPRELETNASVEASGLPYMRDALLRLCQEYPWTSDGLSRSHRQALQAVSQGPARNEELFRRAQAREEAHFLGDLAFYALIGDLASAPALIEGDEGAMRPTQFGRRLLAGDVDMLEEAAIDRWVGGVHLKGRNVARWDDDAAMFRNLTSAEKK